MLNGDPDAVGHGPIVRRGDLLGTKTQMTEYGRRPIVKRF